MDQAQFADHQPNASTPESSLVPRLAWMMYFKETNNIPAVCDRFGISKKTFYKWLKRYRDSHEDSSSLVDRSRRPRSSPRATPESSVMLLMQAAEETGFGQRRLRNYLAAKHNIVLSERTIWKLLKRGYDQSGNHKPETPEG